MATAIALGCGLVGQFVVERLLEHGHEVTVVDLQIPEELSSNPMVKALVGDATQHIENFPPQSVVINMLPLFDCATVVCVGEETSDCGISIFFPSSRAVAIPSSDASSLLLPSPSAKSRWLRFRVERNCSASSPYFLSVPSFAFRRITKTSATHKKTSSAIPPETEPAISAAEDDEGSTSAAPLL